jgi:hypothetical protein
VKNLIKDKFIIHTNKLSSSTDLQKDLLFGNMDINIILFYVENLFHIEIEKTEESDINFILPVDGSPSLMGTMNIGYRKIPENGGFTWRVNLTPIFNNNGFWPLFAGVGLGYAF